MAPTPEFEQVETMLCRLSIALAQRRMSDAEAKEMTEIYWAKLRTVAIDDLRHAFGVLLERCDFMPSVKQILDAAKLGPATAAARQKAWARVMLLRHERDWRDEAEDCGPVNPAELAALMTRLETACRASA